MNISTGRWVSGADFVGREPELALLADMVGNGNHVLLSGQRRMGKTSILRELGRRLESKDWKCFFADVEAAASEEDFIVEIASAVGRAGWSPYRVFPWLRNWLGKSFEEIGAHKFRAKLRADLTAGNWRRVGKVVLESCAKRKQPGLLLVDELPIFLKRILREENGVQRVDVFLSWLRATLGGIDGSLVVIISGSIGLQPLVRRLGMTNRINYLTPYRVGPWNRVNSIKCFEQLARSNGLQYKAGIPGAVYDKLGVGIPFHIQCFFARLREYAARRGTVVTTEIVNWVYENVLLGPEGQIDLDHYASRLQEALEEDYTIAMEVLAAAAVNGLFTPRMRQHLEALHGADSDRVQEVIGILEHDGYIMAEPEGHRFQSHLLKDWWATRFKGHYIPLDDR